MRCYCCDSKTDFIDEKTERPYCHQCWEIISVMVGEVEEEEIEEEMYVSFEDCSEYSSNLS